MIDYIEIGEIVGTHGVSGYVKVALLTDFPERFRKMESAMLRKSSSTLAHGEQANCSLYNINDVRYHKNQALLKFEGIDNMDMAKGLRGCMIVIDRTDAMELPTDTYYIFDLIDCEIYEGDELLGKVADVIQTGSNDVYVVRSNDEAVKDLLIPAIGDVVLSVDIGNKKIEVKLPKGLREL